MQGMGRGDAMKIACNPDFVQYQLSLLPWGGVAVRVDVSDHRVVGDKAGGAGLVDVAKAVEPMSATGRAFVFLPLPLGTALPVHVNGFFELSDNRRDLWYADAGMTGGGRVRSGVLACVDLWYL